MTRNEKLGKEFKYEQLTFCLKQGNEKLSDYTNTRLILP